MKRPSRKKAFTTLIELYYSTKKEVENNTIKFKRYWIFKLTPQAYGYDSWSNYIEYRFYTINEITRSRRTCIHPKCFAKLQKYKYGKQTWSFTFNDQDVGIKEFTKSLSNKLCISEEEVMVEIANKMVELI